MSVSSPHPAQLEFRGDRRIRRWRPLVQWALAIPQLFIAVVLTLLRLVLTVGAFFTVVSTERIPRPIFDVIAMTLRYEWRTASYALGLHEDYPPFDFEPAAGDTRVEPHTVVSLVYPQRLARWKPLYKWIAAIPHYFVLIALGFVAVFVFLGALLSVVVTGQYPEGARDFVVGAYRYHLRVQAYVGLLTDCYPPFSITA